MDWFAVVVATRLNLQGSSGSNASGDVGYPKTELFLGQMCKSMCLVFLATSETASLVKFSSMILGFILCYVAPCLAFQPPIYL